VLLPIPGGIGDLLAKLESDLVLSEPALQALPVAYQRFVGDLDFNLHFRRGVDGAVWRRSGISG
jgi:hypothetical protein